MRERKRKKKRGEEEVLELTPETHELKL